MEGPYCIDLDFGCEPFHNDFDINSLKILKPKPTFKHSKVDPQSLSKELLSIFDKQNLRIHLAEAFFLPKFQKLRIHCDGLGSNDYTKINWIWGGKNSAMYWYQLKQSTAPRIGKTNIGVDYEHYEPEEVELIHQQAVGFPSLLQVGGPHNVRAGNEERLALSIILVDQNTNKNLSFAEALQRFDSFVKR